MTATNLSTDSRKVRLSSRRFVAD